MPRIPRHGLSIRTELSGPLRSPDRDKSLRLVKHIEINPQIQQLLEKPTWSVTSLMPPSTLKPKSPSTPKEGQRKDSGSQAPLPTSDGEEEITVEKLHHLLRLSALPIPKYPDQTQRMLQALREQLHFVREIQKVDTRGVEPLVAIRDETAEAREERTITKESLAAFIALEEKKGRNGTIRRVKDASAEKQRGEDQLKDPFAMGEGGDSRRMGRYFVVKRKEKDKEKESLMAKGADVDVDSAVDHKAPTIQPKDIAHQRHGSEKVDDRSRKHANEQAGD